MLVTFKRLGITLADKDVQFYKAVTDRYLEQEGDRYASGGSGKVTAASV